MVGLLSPMVNQFPRAYGDVMSLSDPYVQDITGAQLSQVAVNSQLALTSKIVSMNISVVNFTAIFDVRDSNGITVYLGWISGRIHPSDSFNFGISWTPTQQGNFEIRTFAVTNLKDPRLISDVRSSYVRVVAESLMTVNSVIPLNQSVPATPSTFPLSKITNFTVSGDPYLGYDLTFGLADATDALVGANGVVSISLKDRSDTIVYSNTFNVTKSDFKSHIQGGSTLFGYSWNIASSDLHTGVGMVDAVLTFTTQDNRTLSAGYGNVTIPQSPDKIHQYYENKYLSSAINVGQAINNGFFQITLTRIGHFAHLQYDTSGYEVNSYRADFSITNTQQIPHYTPGILNFVILDNRNNQYNPQYYGNTLKTATLIYPGVMTTGSVVYDDISSKATSLRILLTDYECPPSGYGCGNVSWEFNVNLPDR